MNGVTVRACAKLNLTLEVGGRRADGYHDMTMLMQSVDLCDTVTVALDPSGQITVRCGDLSGPDNLAYRAAERYRQAAGVTDGVCITVEKRIPVCSGLAGGSADAAAVLGALDRLLGAVEPDRLAAVALSLGADVPFAMVGGTACVRGIGEIIQPVAPLPPCFFVLAKAGVKDSTGKMFARLDAVPDRVHPDTEAVVRALAEGNLTAAAQGFGNAFDPLWQNDLARQIRCVMREHGAVQVALSGSGPTLFGVFAAEEDAERCRGQLSGITECFVCRPTDRSLFFE